MRPPYYPTIADEPIRLHAEVETVEFVPHHDVSAFALGDPLAGLAIGGDVFIQSPLADPEAIWASIPAEFRAEIVARRIRVTALDTTALARRHAPRPELEIRMQGVALVGVLLRVSPFAERAGLGRDELVTAVRERLGRFFGHRAEHHSPGDLGRSRRLPAGTPHSGLSGREVRRLHGLSMPVRIRRSWCRRARAGSRLSDRRLCVG